MTDERDEIEEYTAEELLEQAQINAQSLFLATAEGLSADPDRMAEWRESLATTFIRGWDTEQEWEPADILFALVTNYQAYGAEVVEAGLDAPVPFAVLANLPNVYLAEALEIAPDRMTSLFMVGQDLARRLGGRLEWTLSPEHELRLEVTPA